MLSDLWMTLCFMFIFALAYRNRGMEHTASWDGTTVNRLLSWVLPVTLTTVVISVIYGMPWWVGLLSGAITFGGLCIGHGFAQSFGWKQYLQMGLVCFTRLQATLLPLQLAIVYYPTPLFWVLWAVPPVSFFLFWGASALGYTTFFNTKTFRLFGINWCTPGSSEWEELFIGATYGLCFAVIILIRFHIEVHHAESWL